MPLTSHFEGPQAQWYQFLKHHQKAQDGTLYCSDLELQTAFISFSNTVERLGLYFYEDDFSLFEGTDVNPIVLLGRWHTTMTHRHLKKEDHKAQWQVLTKLALATGSEAIRAITDCEYDEHFCGFILPEMELVEDGFDLRGYLNGRGFRRCLVKQNTV